MVFFLDASALVKRYHDEPGSETMRALLKTPEPDRDFYISDHVGLEVLVSLQKLGRKGTRRTQRALRLGLGRFTVDRQQYFNVIGVDSSLIAEAEALAAQYADSGAGTLDLIHLASAHQVQRNVPGERLVFVAADRKLRHVATRAGFRTFDPEREPAEALGA